jgi:uncharacterized protein (TIGR02266 family)
MNEPQRRSVDRLAIEVAVDFVSEHNFFAGFSLNVSEGGLFVATHMHQPVGTKVAITLALPDDGEPLALMAEVRWIREHKDDSEASAGMGLRFLALSPEAEARIQSFVKRVRDPLFFEED